jgi:hypothetical protein
MTMHYTVTVTDWTKPRGYRGSGRGWRVSCFGLPDDDSNAMGLRVAEEFHRNESKARRRATELARQYDAKVLD